AHRGARFAGPLGHAAHTLFLDRLPLGAADRLHDSLANRLANVVAAFAIMRFALRGAKGVATFARVLFAKLLASHVAFLVAMLVIDRLAIVLDAILVAGLGHLPAHRAVALLVEGLVNRLVHDLRHGALLILVNRLVREVLNLLHHGLVNRPGHGA